ncbi:MAG TPA: response regulator [Allosphingosinicella sp.]|nr:response regulator [Allosphingosinicella sp.]
MPDLAPGPPGTSRPLLLLIDDEPFVSRFLAHAAEECGYRALATATADSFRREYRLLGPDVIALDLAMPGGDGVELLRFLAAEQCRAPVLIVSGFDRRVLESSMRLGEKLGLDMIGPLAKPILVAELQEVLGSVRAKEAA